MINMVNDKLLTEGRKFKLFFFAQPVVLVYVDSSLIKLRI